MIRKPADTILCSLTDDALVVLLMFDLGFFPDLI